MVKKRSQQRAVARRFRVGLGTVQRWVARAGQGRLDRVDWADRSHRPHRSRQTPLRVEARVMELRHELKTTSDLGEYGAAAIARALRAEGGVASNERTIDRILARHGAFDAARRIRRPPPPPGWYLPACAAGHAELDSWDFVEGLVIAQGPEVEVLTVIALHSGWPGAWPGLPYTAVRTLDTMLQHWRAVGVPDYAQFDNDTRFQGAHQHRDVISRVRRTCLQLQVIPVFAPPREQGFQNRLENFNGRWQSKGWARFRHESLDALQHCSARYISAARMQVSARLEGAPPPPTAGGWVCARLAGATPGMRRVPATDDRHRNRLALAA